MFVLLHHYCSDGECRCRTKCRLPGQVYNVTLTTGADGSVPYIRLLVNMYAQVIVVSRHSMAQTWWIGKLGSIRISDALWCSSINLDNSGRPSNLARRTSDLPSTRLSLPTPRPTPFLSHKLNTSSHLARYNSFMGKGNAVPKLI